MKQNRIIFCFLLLALCSLLYASVAFAEDICFTPEAASKLVVELEQCRNTAEQNTLLEQALASCTSQIEICKEKQEQNNKACDEMIKAVKPSFMDKARLFFFGTSMGVIITAIGVLAL